MSLACSCFVNPTCGNAELRALMEMKSSLDPENKHLSSWTADGDPCGGAFEGVACNQHRKVANISLQGKGLTGKVPPAWRAQVLVGLYLHYNSLSGEIPREIANLTELTDLYLNVNNLTGTIPPEIGSMASLQVLQLCCNHLTGSIPTEMVLETVFALETNGLTGQIPASLGDLGMLKRLYLSFNQLSGPIPVRLANNPSLEVLDVQNNTLSGVVPSGLRRLNEGFHFDNNPGLCGTAFSSLRACTAWDNLNINQVDTSTTVANRTTPTNVPQSAAFPLACNQSDCSRSSSRLPQIGIVAGVITVTVALMVVVFVGVVRYRRRKQKVGNKSDTSDDRLSIDQVKDVYKRSPSPLVALEYSNSWNPTNAAQDCNGLCHVFLQGSKFNLEEVESATQHFSEYLDAEDDTSSILDWPTRVSIIHGIAKESDTVKITSLRFTIPFLIFSVSIGSFHESVICYSNYSFLVTEFLLAAIFIEDVMFFGVLRFYSLPLILDSGLLKLLADDVVYSALKVSAALGYMAPEYITTGRFTEKSDVYAFGVIILQVLSGQRKLTSLMRTAAESGKLEEFVDPALEGKFSETEAARLTKIALDCTDELPDSRPSMVSVVRDLNEPSCG
ncbi:putative LRR receptor-like serine/threonine-protein kinase [Sesamum angolense]|uniref:LRR receptor-like serine/threonine-protein kinase n=1 Tax=Sesamum angolense TaxID=2727404 RepID=A0AAE1W9V0_9LAMI|nr:putative LRR receptor-like serine/threonine-protein kinase [Sesamum angolense]